MRTEINEKENFIVAVIKSCSGKQVLLGVSFLNLFYTLHRNRITLFTEIMCLFPIIPLPKNIKLWLELKILDFLFKINFFIYFDSV